MPESPAKVPKRRVRSAKAATAGASARSRGRPGPNEATVGPDALLEITLGMLQKHAPSEVTRASLARYAQVHPSLIRYYFTDRDSLIRTVAEELTRQLQRSGAAASESEDLSPPERICARTEALLKFKVKNPFYHRLMMEEIGKSEDEASRLTFQRIAEGAIARYRGYLEAGQADGSLRAVDPAFLYMAIIGLCDFYVIASPLLQEHFEQKDPDDLIKAYGAFICDLLINGLRAR